MFFFLFHDISSGILYRHINTDISRAMYPLAIDKELSMLGDVIRCRPIWNVAFRLTPFGKNPKALTHSLTAIGELRSWIKCKATYAKLSLMFSLRCTSSSLTYIYFPFVCFSYVFVPSHSLSSPRLHRFSYSIWFNIIMLLFRSESLIDICKEQLVIKQRFNTLIFSRRNRNGCRVQ